MLERTIDLAINETVDIVLIAGYLYDLDFEARRPSADGHGTQQLSRATAEQLFLAVRIAKIRQLVPTLSEVIDDAMTNVDPAHAVGMLRTLEELAETN